MVHCCDQCAGKTAGNQEGAGELDAGQAGYHDRGASLAGLVIAHLPHREDIPFVVFERKALADLCRLPKAGLIEYRTVRLLEREGIAGPILEFTAENHRCEFRAPGESVVLEYAA